MSDKVSIIIPVYNVEKYLAECLDSAIRQSHSNKEIIIINDGSTDNSAEIIAEFQRNYNNITVVTTKNQGLSLARNTGLEKANGDYIIFLDSDDWLEKETLASCLNAVKKHNADIVFFNAEAFADGVEESEVKKFNYARSSDLYQKKITCIKLFENYIKNKNYIASACLYMYKSKTYKHVKFFPGIIHEDNLFTTQLLLSNVDAIATCLPDRFFHRRVRPGSIMTQAKSLKHVEGYFKVAEELLKLPLTYRDGKAAKSLNNFIQIMISNAVIIAIAAFDNKIPSDIKKRSLKTLLSTNIRYIKLKSLIICLFPQLLIYRNKLKFLNQA